MASFDEEQGKLEFRKFFEQLKANLPKDAEGNEGEINDMIVQLAAKGVELTLRKNYTSSICVDSSCSICHPFKQNEPLPCRKCKQKIVPHEPPHREICQYHKNDSCLKLESFGVDTKPADTKNKSSNSQSTNTNFQTMSFGDPSLADENKWGVKKCGCKIHIHPWTVCDKCSPFEFMDNNNSITWRHYIAEEAMKKECAFCGKSDKTLVCSKCKKVRYCSVDCNESLKQFLIVGQRKHWSVHKTTC